MVNRLFRPVCQGSGIALAALVVAAMSGSDRGPSMNAHGGIQQNLPAAREFGGAPFSGTKAPSAVSKVSFSPGMYHHFP